MFGVLAADDRVMRSLGKRIAHRHGEGRVLFGSNRLPARCTDQQSALIDHIHRGPVPQPRRSC